VKANGRSAADSRDQVLAEIFHAMSQPLTTLECGLELAIRYDTTLVQVRHRLKVLLEAAQVLHQRLLELRAMQDEADSDARATGYSKQ
jgi:hypothetical protein